MGKRHYFRIYKPTGRYLLKGASQISVYETYNEAYYELIERQEQFPEHEWHISPQMYRILQDYGPPRSKVPLTWAPVAGVPTIPALPYERYHYTSGWIYAVCEQDALPLVKIGTTGNLPQRMMQLCWLTHSPIILLAAVYASSYAYQVEHCIHNLLASSRIEGEWFYLPMTQNALEALVSQAVTFVGEIPPKKAQKGNIQP
jgi:hypothetical protein